MVYIIKTLCFLEQTYFLSPVTIDLTSITSTLYETVIFVYGID